jgi:hypothetical protein
MSKSSKLAFGNQVRPYKGLKVFKNSSRFGKIKKVPPQWLLFVKTNVNRNLEASLSNLNSKLTTSITPLNF